jgi:hypothetical protein
MKMFYDCLDNTTATPSPAMHRTKELSGQLPEARQRIDKVKREMLYEWLITLGANKDFAYQTAYVA